jgi:hypothetical protein
MTFSFAIADPFTAPAIIPARMRRMKIDKQIVHFYISSLFLIWFLVSLSTMSLV